MAEKEIGVIVHYPTTTEGWDILRKKVAQAKAEAIITVINKAPAKYKEELFNIALDSVKKGTY